MTVQTPIASRLADAQIAWHRPPRCERSACTRTRPCVRPQMQPMNATRQLAQYVHQSRWSDLPEPVRHEAVRAFVNWVGCACGGVSHPAFSLGAELVVHRREHRVGVGQGLRSLNPLFVIIGNDVHIRVELAVPATHWVPAHLPALGR